MESRLRLDGEYHIKIMRFWYVYLLVYGLFFWVYLDYILELMAGGFIFFYFVVLTVVGARYYREILKNLLSTLLEIEGTLYAKTIHPTYVPKYQMDYKKVILLESLPLIDVFLTYGVALLILKSGTYFGNVIFGAMILSLCILTRNIFYITKAFSNRDGVFEYTRYTLKVYKEIPEDYVNQFEYQGSDIRQSVFDKEMYK